MAAVLAALLLLILSGPRARMEERWVEPALPDSARGLEALARHLDSTEASVPSLRPGDAKGVFWADPDAPSRTPVALVYLHGFSADRHEMEPVISELAAELGANAYFTRLRGHGRDGSAMGEARAEAWLDDTAEAVAIGSRLGERVVLVGTSTGGTLATWAATRPEARERIDAIVLVSPNFQPRDRSSRILLLPWGGVLARAVVGPERCFEAVNEGQERHWTTCYPTSALLPMMALVERVRTTPLDDVEVPFLLIYSPDDSVVDAGETMAVLNGLLEGRLRGHVVEGSTDPAQHVLAGDILSPGTNDEVRGVMRDFIVDILNVDIGQTPTPTPN